MICNNVQFLFVFGLYFCNACFGEYKTEIRRSAKFPAMGIEVQIVAYVNDDNLFSQYVASSKAKIDELNRIFSNYRDDSEISKIVGRRSSSIGVSDHLFEVLRLSNRLVGATEGAFDPTVGSVSDIWRMARKRNRLPEIEKIRFAVDSVGWKRFVKLGESDRTVSVSNPELRFDFGGIAKGYAADCLLELALEMKIRRLFINVGGDITFGDRPEKTLGWATAVGKDLDSKLLVLSNIAIATSGDSKQRIVKDGVRYSHIIDPRTGWAIKDSNQVTVVGKSCAECDALASALSVMQIKAGIALVEEMPGYEARIYSTDKQQTTGGTTGFARYYESSLFADPASRLGN